MSKRILFTQSFPKVSAQENEKGFPYRRIGKLEVKNLINNQDFVI